jgi:hypothetical protein
MNKLDNYIELAKREGTLSTFAEKNKTREIINQKRAPKIKITRFSTNLPIIRRIIAMLSTSAVVVILVILGFYQPPNEEYPVNIENKKVIYEHVNRNYEPKVFENSEEKVEPVSLNKFRETKEINNNADSEFTNSYVDFTACDLYADTKNEQTLALNRETRSVSKLKTLDLDNQEKSKTNPYFDENGIQVFTLDGFDYKHRSLINGTYYTRKKDSDIDLDLENLKWTDISFDDNTWNFGAGKFFDIRRVDKDGIISGGYIGNSIRLENEDLIQLMGMFEKSINNEAIIKDVNNIAFIPFVEYYSRLNSLITKYKKSGVPLELIELFSHVVRKLTEEPYKEYQYASNKGIFLEKEEYEKLGFVFGKDYFTYPFDLYFEDGDFHEKSIYTEEWSNIREAGYRKIPEKGQYIHSDRICKWKLRRKGLLGFNDDSLKINQRTRTTWNHIDSVQFITHGDESLILRAAKALDNGGRLLQGNIIHTAFESFEPRTIAPVFMNGIGYGWNTIPYQFAKDSATIALKKMGDEVKKMNILHHNKVFENREDSIKNAIQRKFMNKHYENKKLEWQYTNLIPVSIQIPYGNWSMEDLQNKPDKYDYLTLWYYPEDLIEILPIETKHQIEEEIELSASIKEGEISPQEACDMLGDKESILGLCKLTPNNLSKLNLYPNPAHNQAKISFKLATDRYMKAVILDYTGSFIKDLTEWKEYDDGINEISLNLTGIKSGTYTIVLITEKNEQYKKKIIIK